MTPQRVTLITLGVADLERSRKFYAALGWTPTREQDDISFYQINGLVLGLFGPRPARRGSGPPRRRAWHRGDDAGAELHHDRRGRCRLRRRTRMPELPR